MFYYTDMNEKRKIDIVKRILMIPISCELNGLKK